MHHEVRLEIDIALSLNQGHQQTRIVVVGRVAYPKPLIEASHLALMGEKTRLSPVQAATFDRYIHKALLKYPGKRLNANPGKNWVIDSPRYEYQLVKSARLPIVEPELIQYQKKREQDRVAFERWDHLFSEGQNTGAVLLALLLYARFAIRRNQRIVEGYLVPADRYLPDGSA